jgi:hypothetical protein
MHNTQTNIFKNDNTLAQIYKHKYQEEKLQQSK